MTIFCLFEVVHNCAPLTIVVITAVIIINEIGSVEFQLRSQSLSELPTPVAGYHARSAAGLQTIGVLNHGEGDCCLSDIACIIGEQQPQRPTTTKSGHRYTHCTCIPAHSLRAISVIRQTNYVCHRRPPGVFNYIINVDLSLRLFLSASVYFSRGCFQSRCSSITWKESSPKRKNTCLLVYPFPPSTFPR